MSYRILIFCYQIVHTLVYFLDIITIHTEALVTGHKVLYALFIQVGRLGREPFLNALLQLVVAVELLTGKKSLPVEDFHVCLHVNRFVVGKKFDSDDELKEMVEKWLTSEAADI